MTMGFGPPQMRPRPSSMRDDAAWPHEGESLSDWAWTKRENADVVRIVLNRRTGVRHRVVWDSDYALWFIEVAA